MKLSLEKFNFVFFTEESLACFEQAILRDPSWKRVF